MICCDRDVNCNRSGDVCCCTVCGTWYVYPGAEIAPAHAAALARAPMPEEQVLAAFARAEQEMQPYDQGDV